MGLGVPVHESFNPLSLLSFSLGAIYKVRTYAQNQQYLDPLAPCTGVYAFKLTPPVRAYAERNNAN